ncbi:DUF3572 domain-containing protein [Sphingomonas radiodurans]|uniref:DUF3572 domain-containing protein n=1 Tax=Sphingomonas radiodurans TaxID=2890321 RepID=UPI001E28FAFB|nr:DUF3572 domain-containing protein [Sphingomonas radiodurans]WBH15488.1 DUF3572 domain-containing protein [Sphingomonas radiodurans]
MKRTDSNGEPADALALRALVWTLAEPDRALRLISLTGLDPADLRARITEPTVLAACLLFLEQHEPDLVACAVAIDAKPEALVRARHELEAA